ncbi:MAG: DMT family transporter [Haloferacaceae archaeon]
MIPARNYRNLPLVPVLFVLLGAMWGTSFVAIELGLSYFPPVLFATIRYYLAGLVILGYAALTVERWYPRTRTDVAATVLTGLFLIAGHHAFLYVGQQYVSGAIASVVISLSPVLTAVFASALFAEERLTALRGLGLLFGILGVAAVANPSASAVASTNPLGLVLVFLAAASFALGSVLTQPFRTGLPARSLQGWAMLVGAVALHGVSLARHESLAAVNWTPAALTALGYLTLVSGVLAFTLYFELLDRVGPAELNLVGYLEPVVATVVSWLLLGRLVDPSTAVGFAAIFTGFALVKRRALLDFARSTARTAGI